MQMSTHIDSIDDCITSCETDIPMSSRMLDHVIACPTGSAASSKEGSTKSKEGRPRTGLSIWEGTWM